MRNRSDTGPESSVLSAVFENRGWEWCRGAVDDAGLRELTAEADRVAGESGTACVRRLCERSIRIGEWVASPAIRRLLPRGVEPVRSILFDKTPRENWPVAWHQDQSIAVCERRERAGYEAWSVKEGVPHVRPPRELLESMVTVRIHLDETGVENGALRVVSGSHLGGFLSPCAIRSAVEKRGEELCTGAPGDILLMRPLLLHASRRSLRPGRRRVIHVEFARREALDEKLTWAEGASGRRGS